MERITVSESTKDELPTWMMWYGVLVMIGAPLAFGLMTLLTQPLEQIAFVDGSTMDNGNFKYALRNLVAATIAGIALYKRSERMLLLVFIMRFLTEAGDFVDIAAYGDNSSTELIFTLIFMIVVFLGPYVYGIKTLWNAAN